MDDERELTRSDLIAQIRTKQVTAQDADINLGDTVYLLSNMYGTAVTIETSTIHKIKEVPGGKRFFYYKDTTGRAKRIHNLASQRDILVSEKPDTKWLIAKLAVSTAKF